MARAKVWTKREESFLKNNYRKLSGDKLAKKFGVSATSIRKKEKALGLVREHPRLKNKKKVVKKKVATPKKWTKKEESYLRKHYLKKTNTVLAKEFKTTVKSVEKKLWRLGLKRRKRSSKLSEAERKKRIAEFIQERKAAEVVENSGLKKRRAEAVVKFNKAINLYYAKKYKKAIKAFDEVTKNYSNITDIVYKSRQYVIFCLKAK